MFYFDYFEETFQNLRQHKVRSVLTGFGVAWGIFILVLLLGVGEGCYHGVFRKFSRYAKNSVWFWGGQRASGRTVLFSVPLLHKMQHSIADIQYTTPVMYKSGWLRYLGTDYSKASVQGIGANYAQISQLVLKRGRFLNGFDEATARPVCVIGHDVQRILFQREDHIGKFMSVSGYYLQVVGVLDKDAAINRGEQRSVHTPFPIFCGIFNSNLECSEFRISLQPDADAQNAERQVRSFLAQQLILDSSETEALYTFNFSKETQKFNELFQGIRLFLWMIGVCLLLSGVMGVSNMILVHVKERTQEIGIRKVLGASSREILAMIFSESIIISLTAGIVGMVTGMGVIYLLNKVLDYLDPTQRFLIAHLAFKLPEAIIGLLLLIVAGVVAGIVPAKKATNILPVQALNTE